MYVTRSPGGIIAGAAITAVVFIGYVAIGLIDRWTESPAMKRHVNAGSEKFFAERGSVIDEAAHETTDLLGDSDFRRRFDDPRRDMPFGDQ